MNPIKIGMIGFGRMGGFYLEQMQKSGRWEVAYICDVSAESREEARRLAPQAQVIADEQIIFDDPEVAVVGLFALADSRLSQIGKAVAAGKHIIAEKPIADSVEREWQAVSLVEKAPLFSTVNLYLRNSWYHNTIKEFISSGEKPDSLEVFHPDRMAKRILGIGVPSAFENSLFEAGRIVVVSMISTFGTVQIAANAVANNLDGVGCIPGKAIGLAMITVVGRCIGAGDNEQAIYYTKKLLGWAYLVMGVLNGLILIFVRPLVGIYELSGETMELSIILACIHAGFAMLLWPLSFVLPNALRAANDVKFTMIVSIASMACWRVGFSYIIGVRMGMGAIGVWIAMVVDWVCRVTCFVTRFRSGVWKEKYKV